MMQVVAASSPPGGLNGPIRLAENHRSFKHLKTQREIPIAFKRQIYQGMEHGIALTTSNGAIELFDPCKSVFISVICGEVWGFLQSQ